MSEKTSRHMMLAVTGAGLLIGAAILYRYATKPEVDERDIMRELLN